MSSATLGARGAAEILVQARTMVDPAMREAVNRLHPDVATVASYHAGWTTADGQPADNDGGKRLRPTLALLSAAAAGAPQTVAVPGAVAVELLHAFSLLHDDIMDNDRTRRGRPTAWAVYGAGATVLVGDALFALALQIMAETKQPTLVSALVDALATLCWGQAEDARFEREPTVSVAEYMTMVTAKTGAMIELACVAGATLADAPAAVIDGLRRLGHHLGLGFQVTDDLLGIHGDPAVTGKPVHSDLARRKKTLPILAALAAPSPAGRELARLLGADEELGADVVATCAGLVDEAGGRARAEQEARWHYSQANATLATLNLPADAEASWRALVSNLAERTR